MRCGHSVKLRRLLRFWRWLKDWIVWGRTIASLLAEMAELAPVD